MRRIRMRRITRTTENRREQLKTSLCDMAKIQKLPDLVKETLEKLPVFEDLLEVKAEKVYFVYKTPSKNKYEPATANLPPRKENAENSLLSTTANLEQSEEDLTGTPLECPFDLDALKHNIDFGTPEKGIGLSRSTDSPYYPIDVQSATIFLARHSTELKSSDTVPCFVLCNAQDAEKTALLGLQRIGRIAHTWQVTQEGLFSGQELSNKLDTFKQEFADLTNHSKVTFEAFAIYDAYQSPNEQLNNYVKLKSSWLNPRQLLEFPPASSSITIEGRAAPGDSSSPAYAMWQELEWLRQLFESLETREISWKVRDKSAKRRSNLSLEEEVDHVLEQVASNHKRLSALDVREQDGRLPSVLPVRQTLNVTDMLWKLLLELVAVLRRALQCAESKTHRIRLSNTKNSCQMANLMLGIAKGTTAMPTLDGLQPLQLLVDMGVEKLKNDYFFTLTSSELATPNIISSFFSKPSDYAVSLKDYWAASLSALSTLHNIVEALCVMQRTLDLEQSTLATFALDLVTHPERIQDSVFSFSLQTGQLHSFWEMRCVIPLKWRLTCCSEIDKATRCAWQCRRDQWGLKEEANSPLPAESKIFGASYWLEHMKHICHD